jgi:gas vesicle protein
MKQNHLMKRLLTVGRWMVTTLFCLLAIGFVWQGAFFSNTIAMANPAANLIAAADVGDQVQRAADEVAKDSKNFIRDTADKVEKTANKNAAKVDRADDSGSFVERKAKRDKDRIEQRAEEDAARTQKAVDNTKNIVERTVDNIKDAFSD